MSWQRALQSTSGRQLAGASLAFVVALAALQDVPAQVPVRYGEPSRTGTIAAPGEKHRFLLVGAQANDTLRITFSSQYTGGCCGYNMHQLEVFQGTSPIGTAIVGQGAFTAVLPSSGFYTIEVRGRNNNEIGWYAFQLDRLNNPVGADRIAFNWNMRGTIAATAGFAVYTLRATAGSSGVLRITSQYTGGCCGYNMHYAELVDATGQQIAHVAGNDSEAFTFQNGGLYTLFVAARNWWEIGWYAASVDCQSWPGIPCDCVANTSNYGKGWPGTGGVVPALTLSAPPIFGSSPNLQIGNSSGQQTNGFLLMGLSAENLLLPAYGGTLLVAQPVVLPIVLPPAGLTLPFPIPLEPVLCGIGVPLQSVQADPGAAPAGIAFSRGLMVLLGR